MKTYIIYNKFTGVLNTAGTTEDEQFESILQDTDGVIFLPDNEKWGDYYSTHYVLNGQLTAFTADELLLRQNTNLNFRWKMPERILQDNRTLQIAKDEKWKEIKWIRQRKENSSFTVNGLILSVDLAHISGAVQLAIIAKTAMQPFSINWTLVDNSVVTLDADQMIAIGIACGTYISNIYDTARTLRISIDLATTNAEVDAITWPI